jgi:DNA recombination protein RmuC
MAAKDIADIRISSDKAARRARRLDNFDFEELAPVRDDPIPLVSVTKDAAE